VDLAGHSAGLEHGLAVAADGETGQTAGVSRAGRGGGALDLDLGAEAPWERYEVEVLGKEGLVVRAGGEGGGKGGGEGDAV
jgi:hypothetical protein